MYIPSDCVLYHYRSSCGEGRCPGRCLLLPLLCAAHHGVSCIAILEILRAYITVFFLATNPYLTSSHLLCFMQWHFLSWVWTVPLGVYIWTTQWPGHHWPAGIASTGDHHEQGRWVDAVSCIRMVFSECIFSSLYITRCTSPYLLHQVMVYALL